MAYYWIEFGSVGELSRKGRLPEVPNVAVGKRSSRLLEEKTKLAQEESDEQEDDHLALLKTLSNEQKMEVL
jgi:hypothetical protein